MSFTLSTLGDRFGIRGAPLGPTTLVPLRREDVLRGLGQGELDDKAQATNEGGIQIAPQIRREDGQAVVLLDALQEIGDVGVGVPVVAITHPAAIAEERIRLVEEQDGAAGLDRIEDPAQVLLGLADILRDDGAQVDAVESAARVRREYFRGEYPAGAAPPANNAVTPRPGLARRI